MEKKSYLKNIVLNSIAGSHLCGVRLRRFLYRLYGHNVTLVYSECFIGHGKGHLNMGSNSYINARCFLDLSANINIGKNVAVSFGVTFVNSTHELGKDKKRAGKNISHDIYIEDGCWIGANVTILPGVTIHQGCMIAAGSVVIHNCERNGLYAGVPARRIRDLKT